MSSKYWSLGKNWQPGTLSSAAASYETDASQISDASGSVLEVRPPVWTGTAANVAKLDRENMSRRMKHTGAVLQAVSNVVSAAGTEISTTQADMRGVEQMATRLGFRVTGSGDIQRLPVEQGPTGEPSASPTGEGELAKVWSAVRCIAERFEKLDKRLAQTLEQLGCDASQQMERHDYFDHLNSYSLNAVGGALDGEGWNLDYKRDLLNVPWDDILGKIPLDLAGIQTDLRNGVMESFLWVGISEALQEGRMPRWLQGYLSDGRLPTATEIVSGWAYYRLEQDDISPAVRKLLEEHLLDGKFSEELAGELMQDHHPFRPGSAQAVDVAPIQNLTDLGAGMRDVYLHSNPDDPTDRGRIDVRIVDGNPPRVLAIVPGTSIALNYSTGWAGDLEGTDWPANVKAMGVGTSSAIESATAGIETAIRQYEQETGRSLDGAAVMLAGHSQGGIIASSIAADPSFSGRYDVQTVVTAGSPVDNVPFADNTRILSVANEGDFVPELDGDPTPSANVTKVAFTEAQYPDTGEPGATGMQHAHGQQTYVDRLRIGSGEDGAVTEFDTRVQQFLAGDQKAYTVEFGRQK